MLMLAVNLRWANCVTAIYGLAKSFGNLRVMFKMRSGFGVIGELCAMLAICAL